MFRPVRHVAAPGAKSVVSDCILFVVAIDCGAGFFWCELQLLDFYVEVTRRPSFKVEFYLGTLKLEQTLLRLT